MYKSFENKIPCFITVRTLSERLPEKCLLPFGDGNVVEHVIRRCIHFGLRPVVCTSVDTSDDILEEIAKKEGVEYYRGELIDKLRRWRGCANHFNFSAFHTVDADDPYFDPDLVKLSFSQLSKERCDIVAPTPRSSSGAATVGYSISTALVERLCQQIKPGTDTEMFWHYLEKLESVKKIVLSSQSEKNQQLIRLTLDYKEDYWLLSFIQRLLGSFALRLEVETILQKNPDLYKMNWFRNDEWSARQSSVKRHVSISTIGS